MRYKPQSLKPRQKTLAALLATGASPAEAAKAVGISVTAVNLLMKGELFNYEIDEQRRALIGERVNEFTKLLSEQLPKNLETLVAIRDSLDAKPSERLRAVELINDVLVPKAKPHSAPSAEVKMHVDIAPKEREAIENAIAESSAADES